MDAERSRLNQLTAKFIRPSRRSSPARPQSTSPEPSITGIPNAKVLNFEDAALQSRLNAVLKAHEKLIKDRKGWQKFTHAIESTYTLFSLLAKNLLMVGINAQSVLRAPPI
jgi:hypothetical protein